MAGNAFRHILGLDPYIRTFVSSLSLHSHHRYFIDPRPNTHNHLWFAFALPLFLMLTTSKASVFSRLQRAASGLGQFAARPFVVVLGERFKALPSHSTHRNIS